MFKVKNSVIIVCAYGVCEISEVIVLNFLDHSALGLSGELAQAENS